MKKSAASAKKLVKKSISAGEVLCVAYLALLGVMLPLAVHSAYYDITLAKAVVFWVLSALLLAAFAVWRIAGRKGAPQPLSFSLPDLLFCVFALTHIASTLLFRPLSASLWASDNRYQGIVSFALYLGVFLVLRRHGSFAALVRYALWLGVSVAAALAVGEVFGVDLLGLRAISPAIELPRFFSTVGNITFLSALCVLFLPLFSVMALDAESVSGGIIWSLGALLTLCSGIAVRADGFALGALAGFALIPLLTREARLVRRVPRLWGAAALAALLFSLAMRRGALYPLSSLGKVLTSPVLLLSVAAVSAVLWKLLCRRGDQEIVVFRRVYLIVFWTLFALGVVFLVLANTLWRDKLPEAIAAVAVFSPSWGTDRGAEWMSFWQMFREASVWQKLIGSGSGSLAAWDRAHRLFSDAVTDSAHNEYLHYLLTGGVIGLGSYAALLFLALRAAVLRPSPVRTALASGCAAYAVQAAVNIAQPFTTPLFFALLALLLSDRPAVPEEQAGENDIFWKVGLAGVAIALLVAAAAQARVL